MLHDPAERSTRWATPRTRSRSSTTGPRSGSSRPSSLLYTYGPGAIMDLPQFTIMPTGLDDWDRIWKRRERHSRDPRAAAAATSSACTCGRPGRRAAAVPVATEAEHLQQRGRRPRRPGAGVPAVAALHRLRLCWACCRSSAYTNTHPFRTDLARFSHRSCPGRGADPARRRATRAPRCRPRYLLACAMGHLDEFPYDLWVHRGRAVREGRGPDPEDDRPATSGKGASAMIRCESCGEQRPMNEAQGAGGRREAASECRGRHPHLDAFEPNGCGARPS